MNGRTVALLLIVPALVVGAGIYWAQVYAFYDDVPADVAEVQLTAQASGVAEDVPHTGFRGIDSDSSPLRYRACFELGMPVAELSKTYVAYDAPVPLEAPGWFDCFNADEIGTALESGAALPFLGEANVVYGVDRVVAVFPDGRARSWHQINACGAEVFDGNPPPEGCPAPPERTE